MDDRAISYNLTTSCHGILISLSSKSYRSYIFRIQTCLDWNCHCWIFPLVAWLELSQSWMNVVWIPNAFPVPPLSCDFQLSLLLTLLGEKEVNIYYTDFQLSLSLSLNIFKMIYTCLTYRIVPLDFFVLGLERFLVGSALVPWNLRLIPYIAHVPVPVIITVHANILTVTLILTG